MKTKPVLLGSHYSPENTPTRPDGKVTPEAKELLKQHRILSARILVDASCYDKVREKLEDAANEGLLTLLIRPFVPRLSEIDRLLIAKREEARAREAGLLSS